jgi:hypothetical protein
MHFAHTCPEQYCIAQMVMKAHMTIAFAVSSSHFPERPLLEAQESFHFPAGFLPGLFLLVAR